MTTQRFSLHSLRARMLLLGVLAILPALGLVLYTGINQRNAAVLQIESEILRLAQSIKANHDQQVESTHNFLITVNSLLTHHLNDKSECNHLLFNLHERYDDFSNIAIAGSDGNVICSATPDLVSQDVSHQSFFRQALEKEKFSSSDYLLNTQTGKPERIFAYPVFDILGEVQAIIYVNLDWEKGVAEGNLPAGSVTLLIDQTGGVLARDPDSERWTDQTPADAPNIQTMLSEGRQGTTIEAGADGIKRQYALVSLGSDQAAEAYLVIGVPIQAAYTSANQALIINLVGLGVVAVIAIIVALIYSEAFILRKVQAIFRAAEKIGQGDLNARTGLTHESSELGQLARAFDQMAESLQNSENEYKLSERQLLQSEKRYRSLVDNLPIGLFRNTPGPEGKSLMANHVFLQIFGYESMAELDSINVSDLYVNPDERKRFSDNLLNRGSVSGLELKLKKKDGSPIWGSVTARVVRDGDVAYFDGSVADITERKHAEEQLRKLSSAVEQSGNLVIITDKNGLIEYVNPKFTEITGYGCQELLGKTPRILKSGETSEDQYELLWKTISSGKVWKGYFHNKKKNGGYYWASATISPIRNSKGEVTNFVGIEEDFTDQMHQSQLLRDQEEKLRSIIEQAGDGIALIDERGLLVEWNRAQELITGISREEALGNPMWQVVHRLYPEEKRSDEYKHLLRQDMEDYHNTGQANWLNQVSEHAIERADGTVRFIQNLYFPIQTGQGSMAGCITRDITEAKQAELEARELKEFNDSIINSMNEGILIDDAEGRIVFANPFLTELLGYSRKEIFGKSYMEVIPPDQHAVIESAYERRYRGLSDQYEFQMLDKNGARLHMLVSGTPRFENGTFAGTMGVFTDITERKRSEEQIKRQLTNMSILRTIDMTIASSLDLNFTLEVLVTQIASALEVDAVGLLLFDSKGQTLDYAAGHGFSTSALQHTHLRLGDGLAGQAALERKTIHISDLHNTNTSLRRSPKVAEEQFTDYFGVPLIAKGRIKGVLEVFGREPLNPDQEWLDMLNALSRQAAIAIDSAEMYRDLQQTNQDLLMAYEYTLEGWGKALEIRDGETQGHTERVTELTVRLARKMGLDEEELAHVRRGARLHDIGKMGIPDSILLKPGPLTDEEWTIMHRHPIYAFELLSPIPFLQPVLDIPYCHHEKWDGSGYPRGLEREAIPLAARIFAIVDVWDALRSERPYRAAWPEERIEAYLRQEKGKHFDPEVVEAFFRLREEIEGGGGE